MNAAHIALSGARGHVSAPPSQTASQVQAPPTPMTQADRESIQVVGLVVVVLVVFFLFGLAMTPKDGE